MLISPNLILAASPHVAEEEVEPKPFLESEFWWAAILHLLELWRCCTSPGQVHKGAHAGNQRQSDHHEREADEDDEEVISSIVAAAKAIHLAQLAVFANLHEDYKDKDKDKASIQNNTKPVVGVPLIWLHSELHRQEGHAHHEREERALRTSNRCG